MKLYTSTKDKISEIVAVTRCSECKRVENELCDILIPQAQLSAGVLHQLRMNTVHNVRKHDWKEAKKQLEKKASKLLLTDNERHQDSLPVNFFNKNVIELALDKRVSTDRRIHQLSDRRVETNGTITVDRRMFARVRRSGSDRRKQHRVAAMPKPFVEPVAMRKDDFNVYQDWTDSVAIYKGQYTLFGLTYATLGLTGESGEFADQLKKILRTEEPSCMAERYGNTITVNDRDKLIGELGDVLWYVARCARELGVPLESVALMNYLKLEERKSKDQLHRHDDKR